MSRIPFRLAAVGALAATTGMLAVAPSTSAQPAAPKLYVGLFGDSTVGVIDTATNTLTKTIPIPTGPHGLVVTSDGKWVYASSDGDSKLSVIDTRTDQVAVTIEVGATPHGLAITPDDSRVLVAGFGTNQVEAIDTRTNQIVWQTPVAQPHNIAISPDGQTAYAGSQQQQAPALTILDIASGTQTGTVPLDHSPRALTSSPDGAEILFTQAGVDSLQVLDRATNQIATQIPTGASPHHPLFTPDGKLGLVVSQGPGALEVFDPQTFASTSSVKVGDMPHWIAASSDNRVAYVSNEKSNDISVVDLGTMSVTATVPVGKAPRKLVIQPGGVPSQHSGSPVSIAKFAFIPATITVSTGQSVTWTNNDSVDHTVTSESGRSDSDALSTGGMFSTTFSQLGTYAYHCSIHPFMQGTVVVE
jgi:YVTN family beta-propeller protein